MIALVYAASNPSLIRGPENSSFLSLFDTFLLLHVVLCREGYKNGLPVTRVSHGSRDHCNMAIHVSTLADGTVGPIFVVMADKELGAEDLVVHQVRGLHPYPKELGECSHCSH